MNIQSDSFLAKKSMMETESKAELPKPTCNTLRKFKKVIKRDADYKCGSCDYSSDSKDTVYSHYRRTHNAADIQTTLATEAPVYIPKQQPIQDRKLIIQPLTCVYCDDKFDDEKSLDIHEQEYHKLYFRLAHPPSNEIHNFIYEHNKLRKALKTLTEISWSEDDCCKIYKFRNLLHNILRLSHVPVPRDRLKYCRFTETQSLAELEKIYEGKKPTTIRAAVAAMIEEFMALRTVLMSEIDIFKDINMEEPQTGASVSILAELQQIRLQYAELNEKYKLLQNEFKAKIDLDTHTKNNIQVLISFLIDTVEEVSSLKETINEFDRKLNDLARDQSSFGIEIVAKIEKAANTQIESELNEAKTRLAGTEKELRERAKIIEAFAASFGLGKEIDATSNPSGDQETAYHGGVLEDIINEKLRYFVGKVETRVETQYKLAHYKIEADRDHSIKFKRIGRDIERIEKCLDGHEMQIAIINRKIEEAERDEGLIKGDMTSEQRAYFTSRLTTLGVNKRTRKMLEAAMRKSNAKKFCI